MGCPGHPPAPFGNGGEGVKFSAMPGGNDGVVLAMDHQQGAGDLANAPVVPEFIDRHNGNDGPDPEGGHKRALQDQPCDLVPGGEMKGDSRADRPAVEDDSIERDASPSLTQGKSFESLFSHKN